MCFNPHTHAGCDYGKREKAVKPLVSIHTPTQGVTFVIIPLIRQVCVSIHTPTQGVTLEPPMPLQ